MSPRASARLPFSFEAFTGQFGSVNAYSISRMPRAPEVRNWLYVAWNCTPCPSLMKLTKSMLHMKPMVPNTLIGGKSLTVSYPLSSSIVYATEFDSAIVGMKNATLSEYRGNNIPNSTEEPAVMP